MQTLLIVEDDADINRLLTTLLSKEGDTVIPAYSGCRRNGSIWCCLT